MPAVARHPTADDFATAIIASKGMIAPEDIDERFFGSERAYRTWRICAGVALVETGFADRTVRRSLNLMDFALPRLRAMPVPTARRAKQARRALRKRLS